MMQLTKLMDAAKTTTVELATAIEADRTTVWRWLNRGLRPRAEYTDALLAFFTKRLDRPVTYEEAFGAKKRRVRRAA